MDFKSALIRELETNKALFRSAQTQIQKLDAYQKGTIITEKIAKLSAKGDRVSIYQAFFKDCDLKNDSYAKFIEARNNRVERLVGSLKNQNPPPDKLQAEKFLKGRGLFLEPKCAGRFQSCSGDEVKNDDLKVFQEILGPIPGPNVIELPHKRVRIQEPEVMKPRTVSKHSLFSGKQNSDHRATKGVGFRTASEMLLLQNMKKGEEPHNASGSRTLFNYSAIRKTLGARRAGVRSAFMTPVRTDEALRANYRHAAEPKPADLDERLINIEPQMIQRITNEIMHKNKPIDWQDIAGLEYAKTTIKEAVVWPLLRPDIFTGLRRPPRGILLFGPPGTGKTLIGKCIASQSKSTFFSISASSLTSKWVGDGEKMVRALFAVAAAHQPSVVFIDEIDSLLCQRCETEHESSRRIKTEFLVQLDGANTKEDERILIVGATNRPQELDEAARRRLVRRLYIPLPELEARVQILTNLLRTVRNNINAKEIFQISEMTEGYSGADMETLCREASMEPIRSIPPDEIPFFNEQNVRPVILEDFRSALQRIRPTVSQIDLEQYTNWNKTYGSGQ